jgi:hypothetical protein
VVDRRVGGPSAGTVAPRNRSVALLQGDPKVWLRESALGNLSGGGVAHAMRSCLAAVGALHTALHLGRVCRLD